MSQFVDLHCHSKYSDGSLTPTELVKLAENRQIAILSITDHDSLAGYHDDEFLKPKRNIKIINGIELSCIFNGHYLDILGYGFDLAKLAASLQKITTEQKRLDFAHAVKVLEKLKKFGYQTKIESVPITNSKVNYLIATVLHFYPENRQLFQQRHRYEANHHAWYQEYLRKGRAGDLAWTEDFINAQISAIKKAGGYAYLAHPRRLGYLASDQEITKLQELGLDGLEVYYPGITAKEIGELERLAKHLKLAVSGGSDFHLFGKQELGSLQISSEILTSELLARAY